MYKLQMVPDLPVVLEGLEGLEGREGRRECRECPEDPSRLQGREGLECPEGLRPVPSIELSHPETDIHLPSFLLFLCQDQLLTVGGD